MMLALCLVLAGVWGAIWAVFLQCSEAGRFLAARRAWLAVVIGVGVDVLILMALLPIGVWLEVLGVIAASSVGLIVRSVRNEWLEHAALLRGVDGHPDQTGK